MTDYKSLYLKYKKKYLNKKYMEEKMKQIIEKLYNKKWKN